MCKNAGKTVTMDTIASEAADAGIAVGLVSSGRDGEAVDAVTLREKPAVHVRAGFHVVTLERFLASERTTAQLEIVETTRFNTPLGRVVIARATGPGTVEISGPGSVRKIREVVGTLHALGAGLVLVDGSIDRKALSTPALCDGTVLATGAALGRDMEKVVRETAHTVRLLSLPLAPEQLLARGRELADERQNAVVASDGTWEQFGSTTLAGADDVEARMNADTVAVVLGGALTGRSLPKRPPGCEVAICVQNPTRMFLDTEELRILEGRGYRFSVLYSAPVLAVAVNPLAPDGFQFDRAEFFAAMKEALTPVPVIDVVPGDQSSAACGMEG
ncbi:MAG: hypothetical protein WC889_09380 [Myxococcota bacterium]